MGMLTLENVKFKLKFNLGCNRIRFKGGQHDFKWYNKINLPKSVTTTVLEINSKLDVFSEDNPCSVILC